MGYIYIHCYPNLTSLMNKMQVYEIPQSHRCAVITKVQTRLRRVVGPRLSVLKPSHPDWGL